MLKFFTNIKFWLPVVLVLIFGILIEVFFRLGLWDDYIKPKSYLGNALYREKAVKEFGLEDIHWITIGDSRMDWGIEHDKIQKTQSKKGINHLRMSFESSNFMAMQSTIDWSIANMPNLKGIMLGMSEVSFGHFSVAINQYKVAWPFRDHFDYDKYKYFNFKNNLFSYIARNTISVYFEDLILFLRAAPERFDEIDDYLARSHNNLFKFNRDMPGNICQFQLDNLNQCIQTANEIVNKLTKLNSAESFISKVCHNNKKKNSPNFDFMNNELNQQSKNELINNWQKLFRSILGHQLKFKLVVLPEHQMYDYVIKPSNTHEVVNEVINSVKQLRSFDLLDLRDVLDSNNINQHCQYYKDPLHYNNHGKSLITQNIIDSFD